MSKQIFGMFARRSDDWEGRVNSAIAIHSLAKRVERICHPLGGLEALEIVFMSIIDSYTYIKDFLCS